MREFLFRGKTIATNEWVYGGIFVQDGRCFIIQSITYSCGVQSCGLFEVDPKTVGRFTGLVVKDNVKVFEDDVILFGDEPLIVYWNDEAFQWQARKANIKYAFKRFPQPDWNYIDLGWIAVEPDFTNKMTTQVSHNIHDIEVIYEDEDEPWDEVF